MTPKIYYLSTCDTCRRILKQLNTQNAELREIKSAPLKPEELDRMAELAGSYEALFSRRSRNYRKWVPEGTEPDENEIRRLILEDYTLLKRPVIIAGNSIFAGNSPEVIKKATAALDA